MNDPNGYADRVQRVVDYLAEHLDEALDLEALARVACFSPYHFHRIYRGSGKPQTILCVVCVYTVQPLTCWTGI